MKIYSLEFISTGDGAAERIWHTNPRALERYSRTLQQSAFQVRGISAFEMPTPLTEARMVAFLNSNCRAFIPTHAAGLAARALDELANGTPTDRADGAAAKSAGEAKTG